MPGLHVDVPEASAHGLHRQRHAGVHLLQSAFGAAAFGHVLDLRDHADQVAPAVRTAEIASDV